MKSGTHVINENRIEIMIPVPPRTKKNSSRILYKFSKNSPGKKVPFIAPSELYKQYEKDSAIFIKALNIDYPVNICAFYYMNSKRRVDLANLHEALCDSLVANGFVADDNYTIIQSMDGSRVFYDKNNPRTEVVITKITNEENEYDQ